MADRNLRHKSRVLYDGPDRVPARSYLKAIGLTDADIAKPIVGIASTWTDTMPCNYGLRDLAQHVARGVRGAGGTPVEFNTIAISDGITMGTERMKASLVSREVIADVDARRLDLDVPDAVLTECRRRWRAPAPPYTRGLLAKYAALVSAAAEGAVTRPDAPR